MADSTGTVFEAQPDYLTCSAHGDLAARKLLDLAHHIGNQEKEAGNRVKRWRMLGYEGSHVGKVEWGKRDKESTILRLIGDAADVHLSDALSVSDQVTRLDIAVTYRPDPPDSKLGANAYTLASMFQEKHPNTALPHQHSDPLGGYTLNIGSRESANYLRLYNKEAECIATDDQAGAKRYRAAWRYELEVKGGLAKQLAETVEAQPDRGAYVQQYVYQWCQAHGVEPAFGQHGGRVLLPGFRRRSDRDTKLRHLAKNVRPTIDWLRDEGSLEAALDALGLTPPH